MVNTKKMVATGIIGFIITSVIGFVFHELYSLSNNNFFIGLFSPVNESKWEHYKIIFWPMLIFAILAYVFIRHDINNFLFSTAVSIVVAMVVTFSIIEIFELISGQSLMIVHIISYFLGLAAGQIIWLLIMTRTLSLRPVNIFGFMLILLMIIVLVFFTIRPPRHGYFKDSESGTYGIYENTN